MAAITMDEIARRAGVSRGAVSLALRRSPKISARTTEEILKVADELGYRPNLIASRLARADYAVFGLLVSDLHNPVMADILDGFVGIGSSDEGTPPETYLSSGFNSRARERTAVESFLAHRVKGIVLLGSLLDDEEIRRIAGQVPTVSVGRAVKGVDSVLVNDHAGGRLAAELVASRGHRRIAHIDGGDGAGAAPRKHAFLAALEFDDRIRVEVVRGDYTQETGYRRGQALLSSPEPPTAIFAANDLTALGVLGAARDLGLTAGETFDLVGFDDIAIAAYDYVSLTTIAYPRAKMGRIAYELIVRRGTHPQAPTDVCELEPSLIVRSTLPQAGSASFRGFEKADPAAFS